MAGPVSERNSLRNNDNRKSCKAQYDINGMSRPCGVIYRGRQTQVLSEDIVTEGDRQLQELLKKQINTQVSVGSVLNRRKEFSEGTVSQPLVINVDGAVSRDRYDKHVQSFEEIDELRHAGLTEEEITLKLESKDGLHGGTRKRRRFGMDPLVLANRLREIDRKLDDYKLRLQQPTKFAGAKLLSRQEMDLEQAITQNRVKERQFTCLVTEGSKIAAVDPSHPMNHLDDIIKEISTRTDDEKKHRNEKKTVLTEIEEESESDDDVIRENFDVPNRPVEERKRVDVESVILLPNGTRMIQGDIESIPEDVIKRFRLSLDQIKQLPRFKEYEPGKPNQTIYLKNLSPRVTESDLVSLFDRFQKKDEAKIIFRLLKGRMKGQAFVTFPSVETATAAVNLVNGYDFKGKPIIIEYGKRRDEQSDQKQTECEINSC